MSIILTEIGQNPDIHHVKKSQKKQIQRVKKMSKIQIQLVKKKSIFAKTPDTAAKISVRPPSREQKSVTPRVTI